MISYTPFNLLWVFQLQHFVTVLCVNRRAGLLHSGSLQALMCLCVCEVQLCVDMCAAVLCKVTCNSLHLCRAQRLTVMCRAQSAVKTGDTERKIMNTNQIHIPADPNRRPAPWMETKDQCNDETNKGTVTYSYIWVAFRTYYFNA